jgi:uncharacterized membrane protein
MMALSMAAALFATLHIAVSGTPLRAALVRRLGEKAFRGVFSLATLASLVWLTRAYSAAFAEGNIAWWALGPWTSHVAAPVMLFALLLAVPGILTRSPTALGAGAPRAALEPRGVQRITRHPFLAGVVIWATFHLVVNGDRASVILFATFLTVAVLGMRSIDRKRAAALGDRWTSFERATSRTPFLSALRGHPLPSLKEIGWWKLGVALLVFGALVSVHPMLFGAYPLPGMDD